MKIDGGDEFPGELKRDVRRALVVSGGSANTFGADVSGGLVTGFLEVVSGLRDGDGWALLKLRPCRPMYLRS